MRATNLLLLVMDVVNIAHQQSESVTAEFMEKTLDVEWDFVTYFDEICKEGLIAPVAGTNQVVEHYRFTDKGRIFCQIASGCVDLKNLWKIRKQPSVLHRVSALELLVTVEKLRQNNKEVWSHMLANRGGESKSTVRKLLKHLEDRALVNQPS